MAAPSLASVSGLAADPRALSTLRGQAHTDSPESLRAAARQFEALILDQLMRRTPDNPFIMGTTGTGASNYINGASLKLVFGASIKIIFGFPGASEIRLAAVRGEAPEEQTYPGAAAEVAQVWIAVRAALRQVLERTTLADVAAHELPDHVRALLDDPEVWSRR